MKTADRMFYEWLEGMEKLRAIEAAYAPVRLAISKEINRLIMVSNPGLPPDPRGDGTHGRA
jgi:hypothetical protein